MIASRVSYSFFILLLTQTHDVVRECDVRDEGAGRSHGGHVLGMGRSGVYYYGEDGATTFEYVHADLTPAPVCRGIFYEI